MRQTRGGKGWARVARGKAEAARFWDPQWGPGTQSDREPQFGDPGSICPSTAQRGWFQLASAQRARWITGWICWVVLWHWVSFWWAREATVYETLHLDEGSHVVGSDLTLVELFRGFIFGLDIEGLLSADWGGGAVDPGGFVLAANHLRNSILLEHY